MKMSPFASIETSLERQFGHMTGPAALPENTLLRRKNGRHDTPPATVSRHAKLADRILIKVDAEPRFLRNTQITILRPDLLLGQPFPKVRLFLSHKLADQRVGDGIQPVQRR